MALFFPDEWFERADGITPEHLLQTGVRAILSDLDDTLTCHDSPELSPEYMAWIASLREAGIAFAILSNNSRERTEPFCAARGLACFCHARKPLPGAARAAAQALGCAPSETLILGDQIFTDILCGKFAGMRTAAVPPLGRRATKWIAVKRILERPIWRAYHRRRKRA